MARAVGTDEGHWILARMGKRVLRPGGKELTLKMLHALAVVPTDDVVEFAPGLGFTTALTLERNPRTYTGVEINQEVAVRLERIVSGTGRSVRVAAAEECGLEDESCDVVYAEAILTMQPDRKKDNILREAHRILRPGGRFGLHEIALVPDDLAESTKRDIRAGLARAIKVNARPLTQLEWIAHVEEAGFEVKVVEWNPFHLLEARRVVRDEGFLRTLRIAWNVLTHPRDRRRILEMRAAFRAHADNLKSICIVAGRRR